MNNRLLNESQRSAYLLVMIQQWLTTVLNMAVAIIAIIFSALATQLDISGPGFTGVGLVSIMSFGSMLANLVRIFTQLELATGALSRLKHFSEDVPSEDSDGSSATPISLEWPSQGNIEICNVSAAYQSVAVLTAIALAECDANIHFRTAGNDSIKDASGLAKDVQISQNLALRGISLSIRSGEKIAICGRTGRYVRYSSHRRTFFALTNTSDGTII